MIADLGLRIDMTAPVTRDVLQRRMRALAVDTIRLTDGLPRTMAADVIGRQLVRSVTSVAANYRSACRARSRKDFIAKMGIVEEEADEITVASIRTARMGRGVSRANPQSAIRNPECS